MHAQTVRQITEEHPFHAGFILMMAQQSAVKSCRCGKFTCDLCGMVKFQQRVDKIRHHSKIATGYLTGGPANKALI